MRTQAVGIRAAEAEHDPHQAGRDQHERRDGGKRARLDRLLERQVVCRPVWVGSNPAS